MELTPQEPGSDSVLGTRPAIEAVGIVVSARSGATAIEPCLHAGV